MPANESKIEYELNLIDTPGHVDFSYEVSRSLAACEGVILLVDAFQGVQAQTVANAFLAMEHNLTIVPVLNKIDLPIARPDAVIAEMEQALGIDPDDVLRVSGKTGLGVDELIQAIIERIPPPAGDPDAPLQALVYNSHFDTYKGVVVYVRVMEGTLHKGQRIKLMRKGTEHEIIEIGQISPRHDQLRPNFGPARSATSWPRSRTLDDVHIGDTVTDALQSDRPKPWPATRSPSRWSSAAFIPSTTTNSRPCAKRWASSGSTIPASPISPESSEGLGFGFRCGFLGMLHREIIQQRLERECDLDLVPDRPQRHLRDPDPQGRNAHHRQPAEGARCRARSRSSASRSCGSASCCRPRTSAT